MRIVEYYHRVSMENVKSVLVVAYPIHKMVVTIMTITKPGTLK